jgi:hypothetical protein
MESPSNGKPVTAAPFKSLEDLHKHTHELATRKVEDNPVVRKLQIAKRITWVCLIATAFLFYYLMDKMQEALSLLR